MLILERLAIEPDTAQLLAEHPELTRDDRKAAMTRTRDLLVRAEPRDPAHERRFRRMLAVAQRNPDADGDPLLEELEREDAELRARAQA